MPTAKIIANWKNKVYDAVYWLEGEEPFYIDQVVEFAEKQLLPESEQAFNLSIFYGKDADWAQVINAFVALAIVIKLATFLDNKKIYWKL